MITAALIVVTAIVSFQLGGRYGVKVGWETAEALADFERDLAGLVDKD